MVIKLEAHQGDWTIPPGPGLVHCSPTGERGQFRAPSLKFKLQTMGIGRAPFGGFFGRFLLPVQPPTLLSNVLFSKIFEAAKIPDKTSIKPSLLLLLPFTPSFHTNQSHSAPISPHLTSQWLLQPNPTKWTIVPAHPCQEDPLRTT